VHTVSVHLAGSGSYDIVVRPGLLSTAGVALRSRCGSIKVAIVTDSTVGPLYRDALVAALLKADFEPVLVTVPAGEEHKTTATITRIYDELLPKKLDRNTPVVALGGGVIGDMGGFVAATILRGVPLVQMPTTLLSMVDASVGGKTGVNHAVGKNLIGAFHQPIVVLIDTQVLKTLPPRELRGGLAECIKHEIIRDAEGFAKLERNIGRALDLDIDYLTELVAHNVAIKARVVEADPLEKGERAHLNFGHTFGHAIENVSNYSYSHGECVALGMVAASYTASKLGLIDEASRARMVNLINNARLPTSGLKLNIDTVANTMWFDKKVKSGKLRLVLPDKIGHAIIRDDVPPELVREALASLL
jgi:3-dehydroquinate synthase